jgi:carboxyl-terminal processing protease
MRTPSVLLSNRFIKTPLLMALGLVISGTAMADQAPEQPTNDTLPLEELRRFSEVFDRIKQAYVEPVDDKKVLEDAIRGMIAGLDPHSSYLEPDAFEELQEHTTGEFGGVGVEITQEDGFIRVISPIDDTPAEKAGIKAGDIITRVDGESVQSIGVDETINHMRGEPGSKIKLTIIREGVQKPLELTITRDIIKVTSVKSRSLGNGFGYVRITQFQSNTGSDLKKALKKLQAETPLTGVVLDLRNNPGGVLQAAVEVVDAFVDGGLIVYTEGRINSADTQFNATKAMSVGNVPVVVLINSGSASASEIVAGALQDQKRAVIMGTTSFGKGSVQTVLPLSDDRALKLTTARYFTPSGRSIQAQGIEPDVVVEEAEIKSVKNIDFPKESDLMGHLTNGEEGAAISDQELAAAQQSLAERDYQLYEALNLLKALSIVKPASSAP